MTVPPRGRAAWAFASRAVRDSQRLLLGYGIGLVALVLLMGAFWPTIEEQGDEFQQLIDNYPPALQAFFGEFSEFTTPAGYLRAELFGTMLPLLFLLVAIGRAADGIAGEEERGRLDVDLAAPVSRASLLVGRAMGVAGVLALLGLAVWLPLLGVDVVMGMGLGPWKLLAGVVMVVLLAFAHAGIAFALAGLRGRKGLIVAASSGLAVAAFLLHGLGGLVPWLERARVASLFHYYGRENPLAAGLDPGGALVLLIVGLAGIGFGAWAFERRDLAVG